MSMLAERRRKTKWIINPTKKPIWTTDSEGIKLGKQLMEKMGWSAGKGLGAKEQGIQEPLKVSYKNDTKGMGFKGNDEDWIEHQDEFNSLLSQLSSSDPNKPAEVDKNEIKSLEEKSKQSRARVHYQKFTRGKDLSRYSETDLACILGINKKKQKASVEEEKNPVEEKTNGNYETSFGVTTINSGSILDYFKKKWTIKPKDNNSPNALEEVIEDTLNSTEDSRPGPEHKKSKKRKLDELDGEKQVLEDGTIKTEEVENSEVGEEVKRNRKSKKHKLAEVEGENVEVLENKTVGTEEVENFGDLEVGKESKKHKKSKKKKKEDLNVEFKSVSKAHKKEKYDADNRNQIEENDQDIQVTDVVENVKYDNDLSVNDENFTKKRKKEKNKHKTKELNTQVENVEPVQEVCDHKIKKKKKKDKDKKEKESASQNEVIEVTGENNSLTECGESKSVSDGDEDIQELDLVEDTALEITIDLESGKSRTEKRRKEKHKLDESKLENQELEIICEYPTEVEYKYKSKSKKRKQKLSDQSLVENEEEQEIRSKSVLEEVEPVVKEKKKKDKDKKEKESASQNEVVEVTGEDYSDKHNSSTGYGESKSVSNGDEDIQELDLVEDTALEITIDLESGKSRTEKRRKDKHKSDESKLENEELEIICEYPAEVEYKSKSKKRKEKLSDQSLAENEEEQEIRSKSVLEGVEPVVKEKKKKDKDKKERESVSQNEVIEVTGENNSYTECGESKSVSNGDEDIQELDLVEDTALEITIDLESGKSRTEKRRKEKHKLDESKLENEELEIICEYPTEIEYKYKSKSKKRKEKLSDQSLVENEEEQDIRSKGVLEVEPVVKEKRKKGKHKTEESRLENEKEQETESRTASEEVDESKVKEKKKKRKHKSDESTVENEEKQVAKSESVPEEIEPKVAKKKKSKHTTDSEGIDKSNMNSESVEGTNGNINTIERQSDTKLNGDCNKLAEGSKAKQGECKVVDSNPIHSHKAELFKKKKLSFVGELPKTANNRVMGLIFGAEFEKFKGANIENVVGYGMKNEIKEKGDG